MEKSHTSVPTTSEVVGLESTEVHPTIAMAVYVNIIVPCSGEGNQAEGWLSLHILLQAGAASVGQDQQTKFEWRKKILFQGFRDGILDVYKEIN